MNIKFLGTAAAEGVPAPFCRCPFCQNVRIVLDKEVRRRCSVMINKNVMIDMGPDMLWTSISFSICYDTILFMLFSHTHFDHLSFSSLLLAHKYYRRTETKRKILIIGSKDLYNYIIYRIKEENVEYFWDIYDFKIVKPYDMLHLNEYTINVLPSNHTIDQQSLLFTISDNKRTIFYGTDTKPYNVNDLFINLPKISLDVIISDCTYGPYYNKGGRHLGLLDNIKIRNEMKNKKLITDKSIYILTHFSHDSLLPYTHMQNLGKKNHMVVAYDGLEIDI